LASAHNWRFQQIHASELIRARSELGPDGHPTEDALRAARERANRRFEEELKSQEGVEHLADSGSQFLLYVLRNKDVAHAASELLRQGTILLWGAFEILTREIFVQYLNSRPERAKQLLDLPKCRRLFQMKSLDFDTLSEYAFDVSNSMGSILALSHDLTDLPAIKTVFKVLFPEQKQLRDALNSRKLWLLSQRRHLIVHNRGIVDQRYLDNTSDNLRAGELLPLIPDDLEDYLRLICDVGTKLLAAVTMQISEEGEDDSQAQDGGA